MTEHTTTEGLTEAEREALAAVVYPPDYDDTNLEDVVDALECILAARLAAVRALADEWDESRRPGMVGISTRIRAALEDR